MEEAGKLREVVYVRMMHGGERMIEGNVDDAIAVLNVEDYSVAAEFAPATNDLQTAVAAAMTPVR